MRVMKDGILTDVNNNRHAYMIKGTKPHLSTELLIGDIAMKCTNLSDAIQTVKHIALIGGFKHESRN